MSHYYATIKGSRSTASRCGTKNSGIGGHIRGWNIGARVQVDSETFRDFFGRNVERDIVRIYKTKGSHGSLATEDLIAEFHE